MRNRDSIEVMQHRGSRIKEGAQMDKDKLRQYRSMKAEIVELEGEEGAEEVRRELIIECLEIEEYINGIRDSDIRRMFRLYFEKGISMACIGRILHIDKSRVSRKIDDYIKSQPKQQTQHYNGK